MRLVIGLLLTLTLFGCSQLNLERPSDPFSSEATDDEIKGTLYVALQ